MSIFVKAAPASQPKTKEAKNIAIIYAAILVIMAVTQLFTFEEFIEHIQQLNLPLGEFGTYAIAPIIIVAEVFAIPFLLRMTLSPAFRYVSMFFGLVAAGLWLFVSTWLAIMNSTASTVGFLGTLVDLTPGWWAVSISFALVILAVWSVWGLWPSKKPRS